VRCWRPTSWRPGVPCGPSCPRVLGDPQGIRRGSEAIRETKKTLEHAEISV
jgi:hypothetical protein